MKIGHSEHTWIGLRRTMAITDIQKWKDWLREERTGKMLPKEDTKREKEREKEGVCTTLYLKLFTLQFMFH